MKFNISRILTVLILSLAFSGLSFADSDFKKKAFNSVKKGLETDDLKNYSIRRSRGANLFLYEPGLKKTDKKNPIIKIKCKNEASFAISVRKKRSTIGMLNIGLCDAESELKKSIANHQKESHDLFHSILSDFKNKTIKANNRNSNKINLIEYSTKSINESKSMTSFTLLMIGHGGALISPTAIITSNNSNKIALLQFSMPPRCEIEAVKDLNICKDLTKIFEVIGASLFK